jgi:hypothetical protein
MHNEWIAEYVAQETEAGDDRRTTEIVGRDVDDGDGDCVAAFGAFDIDGPGERGAWWWPRFSGTLYPPHSLTS